jgi:hypothetical protein
MLRAIRQDIETRILAGESIGTTDIRRAREPRKTGPKRPADLPERRGKGSFQMLQAGRCGRNSSAGREPSSTLVNHFDCVSPHAV